MENPIVKPDVPYKGKIPGGLVPGRMCRIQGVSHPDSDRFNINFQVGPRPSDDTALHLSIRHKQGYIARNSYINEEWGEEEGEGELHIGEAESWEIILLVDESNYKIAVNGQHFCEFSHRIPYSKVTDLLIDGEVSITLISWEGIMGLGAGENVKKVSHTESEQWNQPGGNQAPQGGYYPPSGGYAPGPPQGYGSPQGYGPPLPPGAAPQSSFDSFLDGAQSLLSGAIKSGAAGMLVGKFLGGGNDPQRGYAHNNAKYGIYPDLPQDTNLNINQAPSRGPFEQLLSGLLAGGGGGGATGNQPGTAPPINTNAPGQQGQIDYAAMLTNLLSGHQESKVSQAHGAQQGPGSQQSGSDIGSFLSGLLSNHNQQPGGTNQQPSGPNQQPGGLYQQRGSQGQPQGTGDIGSLLSGLLSGNSQQKTEGQGQPGSQSHGVDFGGLLTNLMSGNATRPIQETHPTGPRPNTGGAQPQGTDFGALFTNLLSGGSQHQQTGPQQGTGGHQGPGTQQSSGIDLNSLLSSLLSSTGGVHPPYGGTTPYGGGYQPYSTPAGANQPYTGPPAGGNQPYTGPPAGGNQPYTGPPAGGNQPYTGPPAGGNQPYTGPPAGGNQPPIGTRPYSGPTGGTGGNPVQTGGTQTYSDTPKGGSGTYEPSGGQTGGTGVQRSTSASKAADSHFEDVSDELEREMARQGGHVQYSAPKPRGGEEEGGQQYGYYPHPPEQQRGPIENLLSGFLSGGQQPHQQPHVPQFGGGESVGGLGSMGGLLQNFAGQLLNPRDGNHRQNY